MKVLIQRVLNASVNINKEKYSSIGKGLLLYLCFEKNDNQEISKNAINKIISLRIFEDDMGKMNLNINQKKLDILIVSQFTLSWMGKKGNRPSFEGSMEPSKAQIMFEDICKSFEKKVLGQVNKGQFGADMKVESTNDGPVTFFLSF